MNRLLRRALERLTDPRCGATIPGLPLRSYRAVAPFLAYPGLWTSTLVDAPASARIGARRWQNSSPAATAPGLSALSSARESPALLVGSSRASVISRIEP